MILTDAVYERLIPANPVHLATRARGGVPVEHARMSALAVVCLPEYFCYSQFAEDGTAVNPELAIETLSAPITTGLLGKG